ncbi:LicD family protein [Jatrophihabitans fulvus]
MPAARPPRWRARARPDDARPDGVRSGMVEEFRRRQVSGWVSVPAGAPPAEVTLCVDGVAVARTVAAMPSPRRDPGGEIGGFRFLLFELWDHVGPRERITVEADGRPLPIAGRGTVVLPTEQGRHGWAALRAALADGHVFSRTGVLQRALDRDEAWRREVFALADGVDAVLRERFGLSTFLAYGSLLGAAREGGAIAHDDDLDLGYLSGHSDPVAVGRELHDVASALLDAGWVVEPYGPLLHVLAPGSPRRVDLFPHFFDADDRLAVPWGVAGTAPVARADWGTLHDVPFGGRTARVPSGAEAVLTLLYGTSWRLPQPGFSWRLDRRRDWPEAFLPRQGQNELYWREFHSHTRFDDPSPFALALVEDAPRVVVDLGCGDGRDAAAFAAAGRAVLALDVADAALHPARQRPDVEVVRCDVADPDALAAALAARPPGPALFHARFLLHALTAHERAVVLAGVTAAAAPGDRLALEFRHATDRPLVKNRRAGLREFVDGDAVAALLRDDHGWTLEQADHGTGRSPYRDEDPDLYRIVAVR